MKIELNTPELGYVWLAVRDARDAARKAWLASKSDGSPEVIVDLDKRQLDGFNATFNIIDAAVMADYNRTMRQMEKQEREIKARRAAGAAAFAADESKYRAAIA